MPVRARQPDAFDEPADSIDWMAALTQVAFVLLLALVACRVLTSEVVREPFAGADANAPRGAGAATVVVMNALCCVPALLVLLRRVLDGTYPLRAHFSHALMAITAVWTCASVAWAGDKFLAAVSASTVVAALVVLWTFTQLVRSWMRFRIVCGFLIGILLALGAFAVIWRTLDVPDMRRYWEQNGAEIIRQRGWEPDSFSAKQFEKRLTAGEVFGFVTSPNTFAAQLVLLGLVGAGMLAQRVRDRDEPLWPGAVVVALIPAAAGIAFTGSRNAIAGAFLGLILLVAWTWAGRLLAPKRKLLYAAGFAAFFAGVAGVVAIGLSTGGLLQDSLNFRWEYWVGSWGLFTSHPLTGVGWANFGDAYLQYRIARAAEEIRDPHNWLVRCVTELGLVGGLVSVALIARFAWEATRPRAAEAVAPDAAPPAPSFAPPTYSRAATLWFVGSVAALAYAFNLAAAVDFASDPGYWMFEALKRLLYAVLLAMGLMIGGLLPGEKFKLDDRPAPLAAAGGVIALLIFLLHSCIDVAMFETGAMLLAATLLGSLIGLKAPSVAGKRFHRGAAVGAAAAAAIAWVAAVVAFVVPTVIAEDRAWAATQAVRNGMFVSAATELDAAYKAAPVSNAEYLARAADLLITADARARQERRFIPELDPRPVLARAIDANRNAVAPYLTRARYTYRLPHRDAAAMEYMLADYAIAAKLNPKETSILIEYGHLLEEAGRGRDAATHYRAALAVNDAYRPDEPERLTATQVSELKAAIARLAP